MFVESKNKELLEKLSELEHIQWESWSKSLMVDLEKLINGDKSTIEKTKERLKIWNEECFMDYKDLSEKMKEYDREWARKVLEIVK